MQINLVAFNVPYPPDYGGIIDIYYRITALKAQGVGVILHCFTYEAGRAEFPAGICSEVYYYRRRTGLLSHLGLLPYNVASRRSGELVRNLAANRWPVLFESLHSCHCINDRRLGGRLMICRAGNVEHDYYLHLAKACRNWAARAFHLLESRRLRRFEEALGRAGILLAVSQRDADYFRGRFPGKRVVFMPVFHLREEVASQTGLSDFILYHAKLSVHENEKAAMFLISKVFPALGCTCVIAGMNPSARLLRAAAACPNIRVEANPPAGRMAALTAGAQVHLLPTFQPTGLKLKLLNSLFEGRHVVVNAMMLEGSGLNALCHIADSAPDMIAACRRLLATPFGEDEVSRRRAVLIPFYTSSYQAARLKELVEGAG
ncbi:MAG: glycosyltransferase [Tannerellaceae bacterium]|jgi:hypothetical protein|nr:glycosyltransferase [Tannerellaceae bacterium]